MPYVCVRVCTEQDDLRCNTPEMSGRASPGTPTMPTDSLRNFTPFFQPNAGLYLNQATAASFHMRSNPLFILAFNGIYSLR
jgi:hypothetical protein